MPGWNPMRLCAMVRGYVRLLTAFSRASPLLTDFLSPGRWNIGTEYLATVLRGPLSVSIRSQGTWVHICAVADRGRRNLKPQCWQRTLLFLLCTLPRFIMQLFSVLWALGVRLCPSLFVQDLVLRSPSVLPPMFQGHLYPTRAIA